MSVPIEPIGSAPVRAIGAEEDLLLLGGVAERALLGDDGAVLRREEVALRQVLEVHEPGVEPLRVGMGGGEGRT